jgi:hypothetical protein
MTHLIRYDMKGKAINTHTLGDKTLIGRNSNSDVKLESLYVSRRHAFIFNHFGEKYLVDLGSIGGTYVFQTDLEDFKSGKRLTDIRENTAYFNMMDSIAREDSHKDLTLEKIFHLTFDDPQLRFDLIEKNFAKRLSENTFFNIKPDYIFGFSKSHLNYEEFREKILEH